HLGRVSAVSDLAKAIRYAIRHWPGLVVFLEDGRVEMDTNVVERAIRPNTLTRKNALFAGNDGGARHWAIAMTLIQTAKLNGVNPMAYLTDVLERIVSGRTKSRMSCTPCCHGTGQPAHPSRSPATPLSGWLNVGANRQLTTSPVIAVSRTLQRIRGMQLGPVCGGEVHVGQHVGLYFVHRCGEFRQFGPALI